MLLLLCTATQGVASSTSWQTGFNAANILCGVGLLATPYALAISGVGSLALLILIGESTLGRCNGIKQAQHMHGLEWYEGITGDGSNCYPQAITCPNRVALCG